jgi:hypothetical protein
MRTQEEERRNRALRLRRANDAAWRVHDNQAKREYRSRKKAEKLARAADPDAVEPEKEEPTERAPRDPIDGWFRVWLHLNSEDEEIVAGAIRTCRNKMEMLLAANRAAACPYVDPDAKDADEDA